MVGQSKRISVANIFIRILTIINHLKKGYNITKSFFTTAFTPQLN